VSKSRRKAAKAALTLAAAEAGEELGAAQERHRAARAILREAEEELAAASRRRHRAEQAIEEASLTQEEHDYRALYPPHQWARSRW
jgi:hypothetical protein